MPGKKGRSGFPAGQPNPKRTVYQKELDRADMISLMRKGYTKAAIARELKLSHTTVVRDWRATLEEIKEQKELDLHEYLTIKREQLSEIAIRAWEAYEASKSVKKPVYEEDQKSGKLTLVMVDTPCEPNTNHLRVVLEALKEESELVGAYPKKGSSKGGGGNAGVTINWGMLMAGLPPPGEAVPDEVEQEIEQLLQIGRPLQPLPIESRRVDE